MVNLCLEEKESWSVGHMREEKRFDIGLGKLNGEEDEEKQKVVQVS